MFSAVGYRSIKEVEDRARDFQIPGFTSTDFHDRLVSLSGVFSISAIGVVTRQPPGILAVGNNGEYLFLSRQMWRVDLRRIRDAAVGGSDLGVGLWVLTPEPDDDGCDPLLATISSEFAEALVPFEGQSLVVSEVEADSLLKNLSELVAQLPIVKHATPEDEANAYKAYIAPFVEGGVRATVAKHEDWRKQNSISRERMRELRREFAPPKWQQRGSLKKTE